MRKIYQGQRTKSKHLQTTHHWINSWSSVCQDIEFDFFPFFKLLHSVWLKRHVVPEGYFICVNIKGTTDDFDFRFYRFCCVSVSHDHNKIGIKVNAQHHSFWLPTFSMQQQTNEGVVARQVKAFNFWYGSNVRVLRKKGMSNRFHWFRFILRKSTACVCLCVCFHLIFFKEDSLFMFARRDLVWKWEKMSKCCWESQWPMVSWWKALNNTNDAIQRHDVFQFDAIHYMVKTLILLEYFACNVKLV